MQSRVLWGLVVLAGWLLAPAVARSGVVGSPHDFSPSGPFTRRAEIAPSGVCSACHIPHWGDPYAIWPRNLEPYRSNLVNDGSPSSVPNYVLFPAIPCYDCHDYHFGSNPDSLPNNSPADTLFDAQHKPQDIAAGFTRNNAPGIYNSNNMTENQWGGSVSGYYENKPPFGSSFGADPNLAPTAPPYPADNAALLRTGGHYFKSQDPTGSPGDAYDIGDKLPCRDCHDPHVWRSDWQAFIKPNLGGSTGWGRVTPSGKPTASRYMGNDFTTTGARSDSDSRTLCIACHGNGDTLNPVNFNAINPEYTGSQIVRPPNTIAEHRNASAVACVSCHPHNSVDASCSDCHGNPPASYPTGKNPEAGILYAWPGGGAGREQTHARHHGHFSDNATRYSSYSYECTVCHANGALHQDNNVNVVYDLSALGKPNPPSFQPFVGSTYVRSTCANVYCHSLGLSDNTVNPVVPPSTTVPYYRTIQWGTSPLGCNGCHGTTTLSGTVQHGMPEYTSGAGGSASANSHAAHVVNNGYECSVCHYNTAAGTYQTARIIRGAPAANAYHVDGVVEVVFDGTTAIGAADGEGGYHPADNTANSKRCAVSCHNSQTLPLAQRPQWGNPGTATCTACHLTSAVDSNQYLSASDTWFQNNVTANLDNAEWTWSGHGKSSGNYDVSGRAAANLLGGGTGNNPCLYCHDPNVGHKQAANPFRLVWQDNVSGFSGLGWNATCYVCHRKTLPRPGYDPDNSATVYAPKVATAAFVDNAHWGGEHGATNSGKFCWDCHDPHGDRNSSGVGNIYMIHKDPLARQTDNTYGYPGSTGALTANSPLFTNVTTGTNYADNTTYRGICQVCHTLATTGHYRSNFGDGHGSASRCTTCHMHDVAFAPNKCEGCHGGENGELAPVNGAPKVTRYWKTSGHGHAAGPAVTCDNCHDVGSPSPSTHTTSGSGTFNTYRWYGSPADNTTTNTPHLRAFYLTTGTASQIQVNFDAGCYNGPGGAVSCHAQRFIKNHRHTKDAGYVVQFGRNNTTNNPKGYTWYTPGGYETDFYMSRSPWVVHDVTTTAGVPNPPSAPYYGVCVSCHDPHGTGTADNTAGGLGTTNHMVRGNWLGAAAPQFCNGACHK